MDCIISSKTRARAFTLIELLVVISIISLLVALLMPVLSSARSAAQRAQCLSNIRQIGLGVITYADENLGYHPTRYANDTAGFPDMISQSLGLFPYSHTIQVAYTWGTYTGMQPEQYYRSSTAASYRWYRTLMVQNPSAHRGSIFQCPASRLPAQDNDLVGSYASNSFLTGARPVNRAFVGRQIYASSVASPARTLTSACSGGSVIASNREVYQQTAVAYASGANTGWTSNRRRDGFFKKHMDTTNALFLDGHAAPTIPNPIQPLSWDSLDLRQWALLDMSIILDPSGAVGRLATGDVIKP